MRGAEEYTCEDTSQICCHKTSLKVLEAEEEMSSGDYDYYNEEAISCSSLARDGYR